MNHKPAIMTSLLCLSVLAIATAVSPFNVFGQSNQSEQGDEQETVDRLLKILESAKNRIENIFARLESRGISVPEMAKTGFEEGVASASEAVQLRDRGDMISAKEKALEAMQKFKDALSLVAEDVESARSEDEADADAHRRLQEAVLRAGEFVERIEAVAEKAKGLGYNVSDVFDILTEARARFDRIRLLLNQGNLSEAAEELGSVRSEIAHLLGRLQPLIKANKAAQAERFLNKAEERLDRFEGRVNQTLSKLPDHVPEAAKQAIAETLQKARGRIDRLRERLHDKDVDTVVSQLEGLTKDIDKANEKLEREKPFAANRLKEIEKLEREVKKYEKILEKLEKKGSDVQAIRELLEDAQNLVEEALKLVENGDVEGAETIVNQAGEALNQVQGLIEQLK